MLNLIYHEKGSHKGQINWAATCPNIDSVQKLIDEETEQIIKDNVKPEL